MCMLNTMLNSAQHNATLWTCNAHCFQFNVACTYAQLLWQQCNTVAMFVTNWTNTPIMNVRIHFQWICQFGCKKLWNISTIIQNNLKRRKKQGHILWIKKCILKHEVQKSLQEGLIPQSTKVIRLTSWQTEFDWADSDVHNSRTVGEADSWDMWSHPEASEQCKTCGLIPMHQNQSQKSSKQKRWNWWPQN